MPPHRSPYEKPDLEVVLVIIEEHQPRIEELSGNRQGNPGLPEVSDAIALVVPGVPHPAEDLVSLEGMTRELAAELAMRGVITREDLAEQSIDDLLVIDGMDEARAGKLIMAARAHWFE